MSSPIRTRWHPHYLALLLLAAGPACAQLEGTLFTTPEERAYLDYLRQEFLARTREAGFNIETPDIPQIPLTDATVEAPAPVLFTLGGIMTSRDGSRSVWLNQQLLGERELPRNIRIVDDAGVLALRISDGTSFWLLRSGQTLDLGTGVTQEAYERQQDEAERAAIESAAELPIEAASVVPVEQAAGEAASAAEIVTPAETGTAAASANPTTAELVELIQTLQDRQPANANAP